MINRKEHGGVWLWPVGEARRRRVFRVRVLAAERRERGPAFFVEQHDEAFRRVVVVRQRRGQHLWILQYPREYCKML